MSEQYIKLYYLNSDFPIKIQTWNYISTLTEKLDSHKFKGYFMKTLYTYTSFKNKTITDKKDIHDYFKRCHFLSILQIIAMLSDDLPQFNNTIGLFKISKKGCIIDDSTVLDKETNEIRDSKGTIDEPHRGYRMFFDLSFKKREAVISVFEKYMGILHNILEQIKTSETHIFDPIANLQQIVIYCAEKKKYNLISYLAWEIHEEPYSLTLEEQIDLFMDYDALRKLWDEGVIADYHGKLRIYILCMYFTKNN